MKVNKHNLTVSKTARFFTLGELNDKTSTVWFVFHGYAQTADNFLQSLKKLVNPNTFIIAPEGLSRFYWKDFSSEPVASWMTKLDRTIDIEDNNSFLQKLYDSFNFIEENIQFNYLGFSQGTPTMSRWIAQDDIKVSKIVYYAGDVAHDIDLSTSHNFKNSDLYFIYGNQDQFISEEKVKRLVSHFHKNGIGINLHTFKGKHKICSEGLQVLL